MLRGGTSHTPPSPACSVVARLILHPHQHAPWWHVSYSTLTSMLRGGTSHTPPSPACSVVARLILHPHQHAPWWHVSYSTPTSMLRGGTSHTPPSPACSCTTDTNISTCTIVDTNISTPLIIVNYLYNRHQYINPFNNSNLSVQ